MLTESEKKTSIWLWKTGYSYQEIASEIIMGRNLFLLGDLSNEVRVIVKEKDQ